jgi:hypothetical protein
MMAKSLARQTSRNPSVADQITAFCELHRLKKQDIAEGYPCSPTYFAQLVRGHPKRAQIQRITKAINRLLPPAKRIQPNYFRRYVALTAAELIEASPELADALRGPIFEMDAAALSSWIRRLRTQAAEIDT